MTDRNYFSLLPDGPDRDFCLSLLPQHVLTLSPRQREAVVRSWCSRRLWTGLNDPDVLTADNQPLVGPNETNGLTVLRWLTHNASLNSGLGPTISCGTLMHAYAALCAALGIYTRLIAALGPNDEPDNQAEYWDDAQQSWVLVLIGCNAHYVSPLREARMSYLEMTTAARSSDDSFVRVPTTGLRTTHSSMERFAQWHRWTHDAVIGNGNAAYLGQAHDWRLWRVWPPAAGRTTVWQPRYVVEQPPKHLLYPVPTEATA